MPTELIFALACGFGALVYGAFSVKWVMAKPTGNDRMREISRAIQEGANAYLNRQYTTIGMVGAVLFVLIGIFINDSWATAFGFAVGAILSGLTGYIGSQEGHSSILDAFFGHDPFLTRAVVESPCFAGG